MGSPVSLETTPCPVCGCDEQRHTPYGKEGLGVARCASCRAYYLSPRPPESWMIEHYEDAAYYQGEGFGYASYRRQELSLRATFRRLVAILDRRGLTGGSLLEVGCGYGYFLDEAAGRFDLRVGTQMSEAGAAVARRSADRVYVGGLDALPASERFDLVAALHVVEHVYEPRAFVRSLVGHLREGGHLFVATPDMGSLWRRVLGRAWPSFKYPEHVVFYDRRVLTRLLREGAGLVEVERVPYPHAFPLSEILRKLRLPAPAVLDRVSIWIPGTTVALVGRQERVD